MRILDVEVKKHVKSVKNDWASIVIFSFILTNFQPRNTKTVNFDRVSLKKIGRFIVNL